MTWMARGEEKKLQVHLIRSLPTEKIYVVYES